MDKNTLNVLKHIEGFHSTTVVIAEDKNIQKQQG